MTVKSGTDPGNLLRSAWSAYFTPQLESDFFYYKMGGSALLREKIVPLNAILRNASINMDKQQAHNAPSFETIEARPLFGGDEIRILEIQMKRVAELIIRQDIAFCLINMRPVR
jgi:hypothetical protein